MPCCGIQTGTHRFILSKREDLWLHQNHLSFRGIPSLSSFQLKPTETNIRISLAKQCHQASALGNSRFFLPASVQQSAQVEVARSLPSVTVSAAPSPSSASSSVIIHQCLKCRTPVKTRATPYLLQQSTASWSRMLPPGSAITPMPLWHASSTASFQAASCAGSAAQ